MRLALAPALGKNEALDGITPDQGCHMKYAYSGNGPTEESTAWAS